MRYIILRRTSGELVLEAVANLHLELHAYDTPEYKNFPGAPKEPPRPERPDPAKFGGKYDWDNKTGAGSWKMPDQAAIDKYNAAATKYAAAEAVWRPRWDRYQQRRTGWEKRRQKAGERALKVLEAKAFRYSFAGGNSAGISLARRVRLPRAADQRKFDALDRAIIRLQQRRTALIEASFSRGKKVTPEQLGTIGRANQRRRYGDWEMGPAGYVQHKVRGQEPYLRDWESQLSARRSVKPKPKPIEQPAALAREAA